MSAVTEHSDTWFTQDVVVPDQLKLRRYETASSKSSGDSSTSSLELEVSRLAQALRRIQAPTNITAVDYSKSRARFYSDLDGSNLQSFLAAGRPEWSAVRWIVVDGVSGDVLQTLAEHYDLHPLAIEDVINFQRIKCISYPGHMYVAAHVWQLQRIKGFAAAAAAAGTGSEFEAPVQHAVHTHPAAAQQQQQQQQQGGAGSRTFPAAAAVGQPSSSQSHLHQQQQRQHQQGAADECRLYVGPGTSAADLKSNTNSRRPATADAPHGATDDLAADLLDTESDTSSLISSLESEEEVHGGRGELEYESDDEDEDKRVNARKKLGGAVFATHPHAKWLTGFRGKGAAHQQQQQEQEQEQQQKEVAVRLNRKLLEKHQKLQQEQQQQQQIGPEAEPLLGTEMPAEAAAAAGDSAGIQSAAADDETAADDAAEAAAELAGTTAGNAGDTHSEHCMRQQLLGNDAEMEAATGAGTLSGYFAGCGDCTACASNVRLVVPLHSSAFNYRPTRSVMRRKRLMMQQVSMFLHSTGVLITIFPGRAAGGGSAAAKIAGPIMRGIRGMSSLLLESEDEGFLLQALLRSCMSYSLPVFGRLADVLSRLDARVLEGRAHMKLTRRLHVLLIDLSILARSFQPMESLLQALATSSSSIYHIGQGQGMPAGNRTLRGSSSSSSSSSSSDDNARDRDAAEARSGSSSRGNTGLRRRGSRGPSSAPHGCAPDRVGTAEAGHAAGFQAHSGPQHQQSAQTQQQHQQQEVLPQRKQQSGQPPPQQQQHSGLQQQHHWQQWQQEVSAGQQARQAHRKSRHSKGSKHSSSTSSSSSSSSSRSSGGDDPVILSGLAATYLEDLLDQAVAVTGDLSAMTDHVAHLNELVVTTVGHANNNANLTLALLGTVFLPLTWIAGIYGMNFDDLPELHWKFGYAYFYLLSIGVVALALLLMVYMRLIKVKEPSWMRSVRHALRRVKRKLLPGKHSHGLHFKPRLGNSATKKSS